MTELEWLKEQSGLDETELKAMEAVAGHAKFVGMLQKIMASNSEALSAKQEAESQRLSFEKRYTEEFIPEMRKVTQDSLRAQGELAAAQARLKAAQEYGIVPEDNKTAVVDPPRAPGSPDPNALSQADFQRFSQAQSNTLITLNDLNAEHFKLFGQPLGNTQELVDEVQRQRTLGNKQYTLKQAWEVKNNVQAKRDDLAKAEQQKVIDAAIAADRKVQAEARGSNPNMRSGQPSRFSAYKPNEAAGGKEPWKSSHSTNERNKPWRENAIAKIRESVAA
jgi:hypothetical protein